LQLSNIAFNANPLNRKSWRVVSDLPQLIDSNLKGENHGEDEFISTDAIEIADPNGNIIATACAKAIGHRLE
jgi:hypothetical protein